MLVESAAALCAASVAVKILPFSWAIRLGARPTGPTYSNRPTEVMSNVRWAIDAAARRLPWNAVCIQRGLATQWMLRRRGIDARLHYGLARDAESALTAHAALSKAFNLVGFGGRSVVKSARAAKPAFGA